MKEITLETKIADLLNDYENMKEILIDINPKFKKLNNPVLRRTLAKVASVKQAAFVGGMDPKELVNTLRERVGQEPLEFDDNEVQIKEEKQKPNWVDEENISLTLDANALLKEDKNPLAEVVLASKKLQNGIILLKADFFPEPLIEELEKKGFEIYSQKITDDNFETYIKPQ
jgi:hypothetical protein